MPLVNTCNSPSIHSGTDLAWGAGGGGTCLKFQHLLTVSKNQTPDSQMQRTEFCHDQ